MQIKKIRILGFKSLEDVVFEPETGFSCLVGSNGAGKSNFCDALLFFQSVILSGVENTLNNFMPVELIKYYSDEVSLKIVTSDQDDISEEYFLIVDLINNKIKEEIIKRGNIFIYEKIKNQSKKLDINKFENSVNDLRSYIENLERKNEEIRNSKLVVDDPNYINNHLSLIKKHVSLLVTNEIPESLAEVKNGQNLSEDKTALSSYFDDFDIFRFFENLNIFRINPLAPKLPNKLFNKSNLLMHGDNLATILSELKKDEDKWQTLHEWLGLIVPSISEVEVKQGEFDTSLSLHFNENGKLLPAISISDGTIYTLSILAAILWNQDKNTLLVIEEPERGIHPQAITELINFMREATTQHLNIITTTHSETFVRNCKLEELWLVDKVAGKTQLKSAKQQNPHLKEASLDQAWLMNLFNGGLPW